MTVQQAPDDEEPGAAPADTGHDDHAVADDPEAQPEAAAPAEEQHPGPTTPKEHGPAVLITVTVLMMLVLSGVAVMIYLSSQS
jgi:hypothetical protein